MAPNLQIALDCVDAHAVAKFWAEALGYDIVSDPGFVQSMIDQGMATEDDTVMVDGVLSWRGAAAITDPEGVRPRWFFQDVPEPRGEKNRMHVDIHLEPDADRAAEVARLEALGATRLYEGGQGHHTWTTMADPEGNEFCVAGGV